METQENSTHYTGLVTLQSWEDIVEAENLTGWVIDGMYSAEEMAMEILVLDYP